MLVGGGIIAILIGFTLPTEAGDANIGAGILVLIGGVALLSGIIRQASLERSNLRKLLLIVAAIILVLLSVKLWQAAENESDRLYCEEKFALGESIPEGIDEFCDQYR